MYMSIAILARKTRALQRGSRRSGWTISTTKSGKCAPCGGGAPVKQLSFRQMHKKNSQHYAPPPPCAIDASEYITYKMLNRLRCDASYNKVPDPCQSKDCKDCNCGSRIGESLCCNVYQDLKTKTAGEYVHYYRLKRVCFPYLNAL